MSRGIDRNIRDAAVRCVLSCRSLYASDSAAIEAVAYTFRVSVSTLRRWMKEARMGHLADRSEQLTHTSPVEEKKKRPPRVGVLSLTTSFTIAAMLALAVADVLVSARGGGRPCSSR